ncbi:MAG: OmpH family outer membrane protein [Paracoccaceae bacterium]
MRWLASALMAVALVSSGANAQSPEEPPRIQSPILTLDQERLFAETLWGQRANKRIEEASAALASENRRIEEDLSAEERALTDKRPSMPVEEFRKAADAFDAKVTEIRRVQDAKERGIAQVQDAERKRFYAAALPVMGDVLRRRGALAVLDSRAIFVSADAIDVTDEMIAEIDAALGAGTAATEPETVPAPAPGDN